MPPFNQNLNKQDANKTTTPGSSAYTAPVGDRYLVRQEQVPKFNFDAIYEKFKNPQGGLIFTKILSLFPHIPIRNDENNWHGTTRTLLTKETLEERPVEMIIGTQKLPKEIAKIFGWGVESADHEFAIKAAHELAHVYQMGASFQYELVRFKTDRAEFKPKHKQFSNATYCYIYLYEMFQTIKSGTGKPITGLASLPVYHEQTEKHKQNVVEWGHSTESALDQQIMEDITELMGAYSLGGGLF